MSKAQQFAAALGAQEKVRPLLPPRFTVQRIQPAPTDDAPTGTEIVTCEAAKVSSKGQLLLATGEALTQEEALALAAWIMATFGG